MAVDLLEIGMDVRIRQQDSVGEVTRRVVRYDPDRDWYTLAGWTCRGKSTMSYIVIPQDRLKVRGEDDGVHVVYSNRIVHDTLDRDLTGRNIPSKFKEHMEQNFLAFEKVLDA